MCVCVCVCVCVCLCVCVCVNEEVSDMHVHVNLHACMSTEVYMYTPGGSFTINQLNTKTEIGKCVKKHQLT